MTSLRRMTDDELPQVLKLLEQSGATARTPDSWQHDHMTALLLGDRGAATAAMPLSRRTIDISPGRSLHIGWLSSNQFASRMSLRRQTRETYPHWPALLPDLDALLVVRRDEASLAARWYAQTGFHDVLSIRCLYLDMTSPPASQTAVRYRAQVVTPGSDSWDASLWQSQMLAVYRDVYASAGGAPTRHDNFWQPLLAHHYYRDHYQFQIIALWADTRASDLLSTKDLALSTSLVGYAVVGWSGWHSKRPRMDILELATRQWDTAVASELLHTTCQLAWSKNVHQVRAVISAHDPYRGHLTRNGFVDRWGYVMLAKWLSPQRHLDRIAQSLPADIADLPVQLAAPGQVPLTLRSPKASPAAAPLPLQGDPRTLTRLLLQRLDITAALQDGTLFCTSLTAPRLTDHDITRLSLAFPWTPWVFHMLDYI